MHILSWLYLHIILYGGPRAIQILGERTSSAHTEPGSETILWVWRERHVSDLSMCNKASWSAAGWEQEWVLLQFCLHDSLLCGASHLGATLFVQDKGGIMCMTAKAKTKANWVLMQCSCRSCELLSHGPCGKSKNYLISLLQSDFSSHRVHPRHLWDGFHKQNPPF